MLIVAVWLLVGLSALALGLNHYLQMELSFAQYALDKMRARYLALAGFQYALSKISPASGSHPDNVFGDSDEQGLVLKHGQFDVDLSDEESKINVNALSTQNYKIFEELLKIAGVNQEDARKIAASTVDWWDEDHDPTDPPFGEEEGYQTLAPPYQCKNRPFDSLEELLLVKGMTTDIYDQVKDFLTIYPLRPVGLAVNFQTASEQVLKALARSVGGPLTNTSLEDADSMARKIVEYRREDVRPGGSSLTGMAPAMKAGLNAKERAVFLTLSNYFLTTSNFLRVRVKGTENKKGVHLRIDAVVNRDNLAIVAWRIE